MPRTNSRTERQRPGIEYSLQCGCGQQMAGARTTKAQQLSCENCGRALFVLPADVYPLWDAASSAKPTAAKQRIRARRTEEGGERKPPRKVSSARRKQKLRLAPTEEVRRLKITPLQRVLLGLVAVVLVTAIWMMRQTRLESATEQFRNQRLAGIEAFRAHRWAEAYTAFVAANDAAQTSRRSDQQSREVQQFLRQSRACSKLSGTSLFSALRDAADPVSGPQPTRLEGRLGRGWMIFDASVQRLQATSDTGAEFSVTFPLTLAGYALQLQTSAPSLKALDLADGPQRAVFAAQVDRSNLVDATKTWVIHLDSETLFLWSDSDALQELGLMGDDLEADRELQRVLERQSQLLKLDGK